jgi:hypothetical protein
MNTLKHYSQTKVNLPSKLTKKNNDSNHSILHGTRVQYMKQLRNKFGVCPLPALNRKRRLHDQA